jgi:hypothetical protein
MRIARPKTLARMAAKVFFKRADPVVVFAQMDSLEVSVKVLEVQDARPLRSQVLRMLRLEASCLFCSKLQEPTTAFR